MINLLLIRPSTSRLWLPSECVTGAVTKVFTAHQPSYCRACELWHVGTEFKVRCCPVTVPSVLRVGGKGYGNECQTQKGTRSMKSKYRKLA